MSYIYSNPTRRGSRVDTNDIHLRIANESDKKLCEQLFIENHEQPLIEAGWDEGQRKRFLHRQFTLREFTLSENNPTATHDIICINNNPVGRLLIVKKLTEILLIDIALVSTWCGKGIGSYLLHQLVSDADDCEKAIHMRVEVNNPAIRLFKRLNFQGSESDGVYTKMKRLPSSKSKPSSNHPDMETDLV